MQHLAMKKMDGSKGREGYRTPKACRAPMDGVRKEGGWGSGVGPSE